MSSCSILRSHVGLEGWAGSPRVNSWQISNAVLPASPWPVHLVPFSAECHSSVWYVHVRDEPGFQPSPRMRMLGWVVLPPVRLSPSISWKSETQEVFDLFKSSRDKLEIWRLRSKPTLERGIGLHRIPPSHKNYVDGHRHPKWATLSFAPPPRSAAKRPNAADDSLATKCNSKMKNCCVRTRGGRHRKTDHLVLTLPAQLPGSRSAH